MRRTRRRRRSNLRFRVVDEEHFFVTESDDASGRADIRSSSTSARGRALRSGERVERVFARRGRDYRRRDAETFMWCTRRASLNSA